MVKYNNFLEKFFDETKKFTNKHNYVSSFTIGCLLGGLSAGHPGTLDEQILINSASRAVVPTIAAFLIGLGINNYAKDYHVPNLIKSTGTFGAGYVVGNSVGQLLRLYL